MSVHTAINAAVTAAAGDAAATAAGGPQQRSAVGALAAAAGVGTTEPLFVSEYLPDRYELAQNLSRVEIEGWEHPSHAGLLTIDAPTSSNTFFASAWLS